MLMAWRSAPPRACSRCELEDQLDVERSMLSKIRDRHATRNRRPRGMTVGDLRCHRRCGVQLVLQGSRSTPTDPVCPGPGSDALRPERATGVAAARVRMKGKDRPNIAFSDHGGVADNTPEPLLLCCVTGRWGQHCRLLFLTFSKSADRQAGGLADRRAGQQAKDM